MRCGVHFRWETPTAQEEARLSRGHDRGRVKMAAPLFEPAMEHPVWPLP